MIEVIDQTQPVYASSAETCWRCDLPMDEERVCGGSGFTLLCAPARPMENESSPSPSTWIHAPGPRGTTLCGTPATQDRIGGNRPITCPRCR